MIAQYLARKGWRETEQDKDTCHLWLQNSVESIQYDNLNKDSGKYIYSYNRATTSFCIVELQSPSNHPSIHDNM